MAEKCIKIDPFYWTSFLKYYRTVLRKMFDIPPCKSDAAVSLIREKGIKTWKDLFIITNDEIDSWDISNKVITDALIMTRNHAIWKCEAIATKATFEYYHNRGYYYRISKYFGGKNVHITWSMICRVPYENYWKTYGISYKTTHFIDCKKNDPNWAKTYKMFVNNLIMGLSESGK